MVSQRAWHVERTPVPLPDLGGPAKAPQSFAYLTQAAFKTLCSMF
jgi:hypothetical protein